MGSSCTPSGKTSTFYDQPELEYGFSVGSDVGLQTTLSRIGPDALSRTSLGGRVAGKTMYYGNWFEVFQHSK